MQPRPKPIARGAGIDDVMRIKALEGVTRSQFSLKYITGECGDSDSDPDEVSMDAVSDGAVATQLIAPVLWSDPQQKLGCSRNDRRGAGSKFGPDVAERFLKAEGLKLLIRSHECVKAGYDWAFAGKRTVMTLFSASNYGGRSRNKGAFAVLRPGAVTEPEIVAYESSEVSADEVDMRNIAFLSQLICTRRADVRAALEKAAASGELGDGRVSAACWAGAMRDALRLRLPWTRLQPLLAPAADDGAIDIGAFLGAFEPEPTADGRSSGWGDAVRRIEPLMLHDTLLAAHLMRNDKESTGRVPVASLRRLFGKLADRYPADADVFSDVELILESLGLSVGDDGTVSIAALVGSFKVKAAALAHVERGRDLFRLSGGAES